MMSCTRVYSTSLGRCRCSKSDCTRLGTAATRGSSLALPAGAVAESSPGTDHEAEQAPILDGIKCLNVG